jgi:hypothetical protein
MKGAYNYQHYSGEYVGLKNFFMSKADAMVAEAETLRSQQPY